MNRFDFIKQVTIGTLSRITLNTWAKRIRDLPDTEQKMPVLFIGHGSPMNAIESNDFTQTLVNLGKNLPKPKAILCISAHWTTKGTYVNVSPSPKMIYDMYGFPNELYEVNYPARGAPEIAKEVPQLISTTKVQTNTEWGFDHGTWSILTHLFPKANVPVFQMSIDYNKSMQYHYDLSKQLMILRKKGVLIVGSGNLTHNLRIVDIDDINATPRDWALEFDSKIKQYIDLRNHQAIINYEKIGAISKLAVPEPSHFFPLIYALALQDKNDETSYFYENFHYGTLSMRGVKIE